MTTETISGVQALSWRMSRQYLGDAGAASAVDVVERLTAIPAVSGDPELAVAVRRRGPVAGEVAEALASGQLIKTYAFRGATHLMTPIDAGMYLALRSAGRQWELPSWQDFYGLEPGDWPALREVVRNALAGGPMTRQELGAAVAATRFGQVGRAILGGAETILKPFAWQGDLCFGPTRDGEGTLRALDGIPGWTGLPELDEAGPRAIVAYFGAYGPATIDRVHYWLGEGLSAGRKRIDRWLAELSDRPIEVEFDDGSALCLAEHIDEMSETVATTHIRLLPGYDQWVLGPGTADQRTVPSAHRAAATRGANLVLCGGRLSGTWKVTKQVLSLQWFPDAGELPRDALDEEVRRIVEILDRPLTVEVLSG